MIIKPDNIFLRSDLVLIEEIEVQSEGYTDAAESSEDKPYIGRIVNQGNGSSYEINDVVLFGMHATSRTSLNGKLYYIIHTDDIWGIINKNTN